MQCSWQSTKFPTTKKPTPKHLRSLWLLLLVGWNNLLLPETKNQVDFCTVWNLWCSSFYQMSFLKSLLCPLIAWGCQVRALHFSLITFWHYRRNLFSSLGLLILSDFWPATYHKPSQVIVLKRCRCKYIKKKWMESRIILRQLADVGYCQFSVRASRRIGGRLLCQK